MEKLLTIVIPVYNPNLEHFSRCIGSILSQWDNRMEVIIVDDKSPEKGYLGLLYGAPFTIIQNERNLKQGLSRQVGLDMAKGKYVTFVDQDDELMPDCLQYVLANLDLIGAGLMYKTGIYICDSYEMNSVRTYYPDDLLHGIFFNVEGLRKYGVHFTDKLKESSEDTFFLCLAHLALVFNGDREPGMERVDEMITYKWYLWEDSTSHKEDNGGIDYFARTFSDYIDAHIMSIKWADEKWPDNMYFFERCTSIVMLGYIYTNIYCYKEGDCNVREESYRFINEMCNHFGWNKKQFLNAIKDNPIKFTERYLDTCNRNGPFLINESIDSFIGGA